MENKKVLGVLVGLGIVLILFAVEYAGGLPRGGAKAGDVIFFHLGLLLLLGTLGMLFLPKSASDVQVAVVLCASLVMVWSIAVVVGWLQFEVSPDVVIIDRLTLVLILLPSVSGIWTGAKSTNFPGLDEDAVVILLVASVITFIGTIGIGSNFALATVVYGIYSVTALFFGLSLHLLISFLSQQYPDNT